HAVMPIMTTYFLALLKDSGDLILTLLNLTGIGAIVGTVLAFLIGLGIALIIIIFWSLTAGDWKGGYLKKKALKKILLRYGFRYSIAIGLDAVPFINIVPVFIIFNIWSHYDFIKEVKKSKKEHAEMIYDWNHGRKISMKNLEANGPNSI
ncbi:hypothetical protein K0B03_04520, partial [Patescibacteria group bacterium]|nr:hypothetical protein [Patescibacteria group bacterium]